MYERQKRADRKGLKKADRKATKEERGQLESVKVISGDPGLNDSALGRRR